MAVVAPEVGLDQVIGDNRRLALVAAGRDEHRARDRVERLMSDPAIGADGLGPDRRPRHGLDGPVRAQCRLAPNRERVPDARAARNYPPLSRWGAAALRSDGLRPVAPHPPTAWIRSRGGGIGSRPLSRSA